MHTHISVYIYVYIYIYIYIYIHVNAQSHTSSLPHTAHPFRRRYIRMTLACFAVTLGYAIVAVHTIPEGCLGLFLEDFTVILNIVRGRSLPRRDSMFVAHLRCGGPSLLALSCCYTASAMVCFLLQECLFVVLVVWGRQGADDRGGMRMWMLRNCVRIQYWTKQREQLLGDCNASPNGHQQIRTNEKRDH